MVVICPQCKIRLKIDEWRLTPEGSRFKCPSCSTVFLAKKPLVSPKKTIDKNKILVAHSNPTLMDEITSLLIKNGYQTIIASDGIDAMVKAIKELPFIVIVEVALPKIYGFEVCKRLKLRPETKEIKFILVASVYDKRRYKREPESLYGADDYIEDHHISEILLDKVNTLKGVKPGEEEEGVEKPSGEPMVQEMEVLEQKPELQVEPQVTTEVPPSDEKIEKAKRLARIIVSDIYLYNTTKADESIRNGNFYSDFASEIKEGLKLYENRVPQEVRTVSDFYKEAIEDFIANKKKVL